MANYTLESDNLSGGRGHLYFRLDIILVKRLAKQTLNTYFSGVKIDPKYAFLHAFFLFCVSCPFQNLSIWPKTYPFFNFARFCTPKQCTRVHCLVWKTTLITWIVLRGWYPTSNTSGTPGNLLTLCLRLSSADDRSDFWNFFKYFQNLDFDIFEISMKNAFTWVQTSLVLIQ